MSFRAMNTIRVVLFFTFLMASASLMPLVTFGQGNTGTQPLCQDTLLTIPQSECEALAEFYYVLNGPNRSVGTDWFSSVDVSSWDGITVGSIDGEDHISKIVLPYSGLVGNIPSSIDDLQYLEELDVSFNTIITIPDEVGSLSSLQHLSLTATNISQLPETLGNLSSLQTLKVDTIATLSSLPDSIVQLSSLDMLLMNATSISSFPTGIDQLDDLDILDANSTQLSQFPDFGDGMDSLKVLDLSDNTITTIGDSLNALPELLELHLSDNQLVSLPGSIVNLGNLVSLSLDNNSLSEIPQRVADLQNLETLRLNDNVLTSFFVSGNGLGVLKNLYLQNNQIVSLSPFIGSMSELRNAYMQDNPLLGTIPQEWVGLTSLRRLYIHNGFLDREADHTASVPTELTGWYAGVLAPYSVNQGDNTPPIVSVLSSWDGFTNTGSVTLNISIDENSYAVTQAGQPMGITIGSEDGSCSGLVAQAPITQRDQSVTVTVTIPIPGLYSGCVLHLTDHGGNESDGILLGALLYTSDIADLCTHPDLEISSLECEGLLAIFESLGGESWTTNTGWFANLNIENWHGVKLKDIVGGTGGSTKTVSELYLQKSTGTDTNGPVSKWNGNNLTGSIPDEIGNLVGLEILNISSNSLSGSFPDGFFTLGNLRQLFANNSGLTGELPGGFSDLTALTSLYLGNNTFSGSIPSSWGSLSNLINLGLNNNNLSGVLPGFFSTFPNLEGIILNDNDFTGLVPVSWKNLSRVKSFNVSNNALVRNKNATAFLDSLLIPRYLSRLQSSTSNQRDILPPIVSGTGSVPWLVEDGFTYEITISEENYALDLWDNGMEVVFSGSQLCESLTADEVRIASGSVDIFVDVSQIGLYENCERGVKDHGDNISIMQSLPRFSKTTGLAQICYHPQLTTSIDECLALVNFYEQTGGETWIDSTNRTTSPDIDSWFGITTRSDDGIERVDRLNLSDNFLQGAIPDLGLFQYVTKIDLSSNQLSSLDSDRSILSGLITLDLHENQLSGTVPTDLSLATSLSYLDLSNNMFTGSIPDQRSSFENLSYLDLSYNQLHGQLSESFSLISSMRSLDLSFNTLSGRVPGSWTGLSELDLIDLSNNAFDRDNNFDLLVDSVGLEQWFGTIPSVSLENQEDLIAPTIQVLSTLPSVIDSAFDIQVSLYEGSFVVDDQGNQMSLGMSGAGLCDSGVMTGDIAIGSGEVSLMLIPGEYGAYNDCLITLTDHAGNVGTATLSSFTYIVGCGNGVIDEQESCDEGKYCDDGRNCTGNVGICPTECQTRMVDNCNPLCQSSSCGDGFIDLDGLDNSIETPDDEQCDSGSWCSDGTQCTGNPSLCSLGAGDCQPRFTQGCNPYCSYSSCGDGYVDFDGKDNILDNDDDEECDDGNYVDGDGCNTNCDLEYCGDGRLDEDGLDNDVSTAQDNESCDQGANNGILGGTCSSTCSIPGEECVHCYEVCDGGNGQHSIFLLIDASGSMGSNNKLQKAKDGAKEFLDLVADRAVTNGLFQTKIGIITYNSTTDHIEPPTTNYQDTKNFIDTIEAGGGTNFGDPLLDARDYFIDHDETMEQHVIILSDGQPTQSSSELYDPEEWALYGAQEVKDDGIAVYTIALEQTSQGSEFMRAISSSAMHNIAVGKATSQSSTNGDRYSSNAVDGDTSSESRSQTNNNNEAWWEIDLGSIFTIDTIKLWNRTGSNARRTSNFHLLFSENPMNSTDLATVLSQSEVMSIHEPGEAARPSIYLPDFPARYVRVQLEDDDRLSIAEFEVMGCPLGVACDDVYSYEDYNGDTIDLIYSHIFGSIHCGCRPERICGVCGDGFTQEIYGEECDLGSICNDGRTCTSDPGICPGECKPKTNDTCTNVCEFSVCGDGIVQSTNSEGGTESCDDGNNTLGDGCSPTCQTEFCGDGLTDINGADNIWFTNDDEACDPQDPATPTGCLNDCSWDPGYQAQDGLCGDQQAVYSMVGDGTQSPDQGGLCITGSPMNFAYDAAQHIWTWYCVGLYGGETASCFVSESFCGDGIAQEGGNENTGPVEGCDDGNQQSGDGCSQTCQPELPLIVPASQHGSCVLGEIPSFQVGEIMPLGRKLLTVGNVDKNAQSCQQLDEGTIIPGNSLQCTFAIFHGDAQQGVLKTMLEPVPCIGSDLVLSQSGLVDDFFQDHAIQASGLLGKTLLDSSSTTFQQQGKYHVSLVGVSYSVCNRMEDGSVVEKPVVRGGSPVCHLDMTVTSPYSLQRGGSFGVVENPSLDVYKTAGGDNVFDLADEGSFQQQKVVTYSNDIMDYLTKTFIDENRGNALQKVYPYGSNRPMTKIPTKDIYFYEGNGGQDTLELTNSLLDEMPATVTVVVINANLKIRGSLSGNGLYIVRGGKIIFEPSNCDLSDKVEGMFVTSKGFVSRSLHNTSLDASQRCKRGDLQIDGILLGPGIDETFINTRRSLLELHSIPTYSVQDVVSGTIQLEELTQIKRQQANSVFEHAALRIQSKPEDRNRLPDGAKDLFEAVEVFR